MRIAAIISAILAVLALVSIIVTFPVEGSFASKAKLIQRVEKNEGASLFGDEGTKIGSPQQMIIEDPKAFIGEPDAEGVYQVDDKYLKDNNIPPLQLKTVSFVLSMARMGLGVAALIFGVAAFFLFKKSQMPAAASQ